MVGGDGFWPIVVGTFVRALAYPNGYAAPLLVAGLLEQGMSTVAASCIPTMAAGRVLKVQRTTVIVEDRLPIPLRCHR